MEYHLLRAELQVIRRNGDQYCATTGQGLCPYLSAPSALDSQIVRETYTVLLKVIKASEMWSEGRCYNNMYPVPGSPIRPIKSFVKRILCRYMVVGGAFHISKEYIFLIKHNSSRYI